MAKIDTLNINGTSYDIAVKDLIDIIYPVGSIYMSVNNVSPATFLGGTWEALQNRFLVGAGDTYAVNATGGEASHTLTVDEMPSHIHKQAFDWTGGGSTSATQGEPWAINMSSGTGDGVGTWPWGTDSGATRFGYTGGDMAHNNLPPYLAVYMWKRIT